MSKDVDLNPILQNKIDSIEDPVMQRLCQLAVASAKDGIIRGQSNLDEYIAKDIDRQIVRIMKEN